MTSIPSPLRAKFPAVRPELPPPEAWRSALDEAYAANWFTNFGALSRRLEAGLQDRWGCAEGACVAASSGTVALAAPLIADRITGPVLMPAFTFPATASAVRMAGAEPALIDIDPETWAVTPEALADGFERTGARAAMLVSPFGFALDFEPHARIAERFGATLIIDSAAGLGVARRAPERRPRVFEIYSLHATKPFGIGEGGAIFCHADREADLRQALNFGLPDFGAGGGPLWGVNGKLSELHAAVGLAVLDTFDDRLARRRDMAQRYAQRMRAHDVRFVSDVSAAPWQVFPVLMPTEASVLRLVDTAASRGLETRRYYRPSLSTLDATSACPVSERLAACMCCFPIYAWCADEERDEVVAIAADAVGAALQSGP